MTAINRFGFLRVAAASPKVKVADCDYNTAEIKSVIRHAADKQVQIVCFPELCITAYTCGDLFFQSALQQKALGSLVELEQFMKNKPTLISIVGLPLRIKNDLFNVAAVLSSQGILGFVPKTHIPNSNEFYEKRWFASSFDFSESFVKIDGKDIPLAPEGMIFRTPFGSFGVEICEDLWMPVPPSSELAMQGAEVIFNLSAGSEQVGKNAYRKSLISQQSARCNAAYIYASAGWGESSTDTVFSGACLIAENG